MKKYLLKFMLLLAAVVCAQQATAVTVYYKNTDGWSKPTAYFWGGNNGPSWPGVAMTAVGDGWFSVDAGNNTKIIFNNEGSSQTADLNIPTDYQNPAYNDGAWSEWVAPVTTYHINHPWGGGSWTWKQLTPNDDGTHSVVAQWGNAGCDWSKQTDHSDKTYITPQNLILVNDPEVGEECTFTLNPAANPVTITVTGAVKGVKTPTFTPAAGTYTSAQSVSIACATEGATIYYTTDGSEPSATTGTEYTAPISVAASTTIKAIAVKEGLASSRVAEAAYVINIEEVTYFIKHSWSDVGWAWKQLTEDADGTYSIEGLYGGSGCNWNTKGDDAGSRWIANPILVGNPVVGKKCKFTFNPADETITITYLAPVDPVTGNLYLLPNASTATVGSAFTKNADGSFTITGVAMTAGQIFGLTSTLAEDESVDITDFRLNPQSTGNFEVSSQYYGQPITLKGWGGAENFKITEDGNYTLKVAADYATITITKEEVIVTDEIPVYPAGVTTEGELAAYDFTAKPVYYLLGNVLNANRPTPEWQMEKGADGKYHINGFAMRDTKVKVRQYTSSTTSAEFGEQDFNKNISAEGRLYNATFDPETGELTFEEDLSAAGKMPFISLVGYMIQQDAAYTTPRGVEGKPEGTTSAKGWQESWLQYDAAGNLLKDRKGNVMYNTMWPPKNPVYFKSKLGDRYFSSDQLTFTAQKDEQGTYVAKTGAEWMQLLKSEENAEASAYQNLDLDENATYYRYVVSDTWVVGSCKIWTGWGGETVKSGDKDVANWNNHRNWGYGTNKSGDEDGTAINPETTYTVGTSNDNNGYFKYEEPTFFKTVEFFYNNADPQNSSKIYTTLAYASASIAAKSVEEGADTYKRGSYQASVNKPEGVDVIYFGIYRYDAATDNLAPIGDDGGLVAEGEYDPTSTEFTFDQEGLAEGRYYYVLNIGFSNERSAVVRSNPFVIHFPGVYTLNATGYQLVKLNQAIDGYDYVTYNSAADGEMYLVNINDANEVAHIALPSDKREAVNNFFANNDCIMWTDKVFVHAAVPTAFKQDAEKTDATVSMDDILNYTLGEQTIAPVGDNKELATLDLSGKFTSKTYKAVMNYQEKDPATGDKSQKATLGKENFTRMEMPNVKHGSATVLVRKTENTEVLDIIDGEETRQKASPYYTVDLTLTFDDPNVITATAPQYMVKVKNEEGEGFTQLYKASGTGTRTVKISGVNPAIYATSTVSVEALYHDGFEYVLPATIGKGAVIEAGTTALDAKGAPVTSAMVIKSMVDKKPIEYDGNGNKVQQPVVVITDMTTSFDGGDFLAGTRLDNDCIVNIDFSIDDTQVGSTYFAIDEVNFNGELITSGGHHVWTKCLMFDNNTGLEQFIFKADITSVYVVKVSETVSVENLTQEVTTYGAPANESFVALRGRTSQYATNYQIPTAVTDITADAATAAPRKVIENGQIYIIQGNQKFNTMGAQVK
ncbi:MAG: chitobiase/beta-hexosaminidase C-terminal domain-containing protein [Bacteroidales bacterium]|nr:chitobiase/beta-hexosaminidase C-terminal domain-containing protein [Bacteroidales bacterium]